MLNSQRLSKLQCLVVFLTLYLVACQQTIFSGVYRPSLLFQPDDAAGAFLIKRQRFTSTMVYATNMTVYQAHKHIDESTIDILLRGRCPTCMNLQTRDFLDYFVESLSTTIENLRADQRDVVNHLSKGLRRTILGLKSVSETAPILDKRQDQTAVVLVFNSDMTRRISTRLKNLFFQATFWSVYRYYRNIFIMVKSISDYETVVDMHLQQVQIINLDISVPEATQGLKYTAAVSLMHGTLIKRSLEHAAKTWHTSDKWAQYKYLYFSVGDQLLHARNFPSLYDVLDVGSEGNFLLAPHRMQTLLVAQSFSPEAQFAMWPDRADNVTEASAGAPTARRKRNFSDSSASKESRGKSSLSSKTQRRVVNQSPSPQWQPGIHLLTGSLSGVQGSCCDQGRILFPDCPKKSSFQSAANVDSKEDVTRLLNAPKQNRPQWATCTAWGARNFSTWMRVGPDGFTMPPVTVHLAHCKYSAEKELCPLPPRTAASSYGSGSCSRLPMPIHIRAGGDADGNANAEADADVSQRRRNHQLPEPSQHEPRMQQEQEKEVSRVEGKVYLHCSEMSAVKFDPYTEHLLSRPVQEALQSLDSANKDQ